MALIDVAYDAVLGTAAITRNYTSAKRLKVVISSVVGKVDYDMPDKTITLPLTWGDGIYVFSLYEQRFGTHYTFKDCVSKNVHLTHANAYMLSASTYIPLEAGSEYAVQAAALGSWNAIWSWLLRNLHYDYVAAILAGKNLLGPPNIDKCWSGRKGICYDLSALAVAMARSAGIPAALVMGKLGKTAHAWVEVGGRRYDIVAALAKTKNKKEYIEERRV